MRQLPQSLQLDNGILSLISIVIFTVLSFQSDLTQVPTTLSIDNNNIQAGNLS